MHTFLIFLAVYAALTAAFNAALNAALFAIRRWRAARKVIDALGTDTDQAAPSCSSALLRQRVLDWMEEIASTLQTRGQSNQRCDTEDALDGARVSPKPMNRREFLYQRLVADALQLAGIALPRKVVFTAFLFDIVGGALLLFFWPMLGMGLVVLGLVVCTLAWER